jgi:hypothetical protein
MDSKPYGGYPRIQRKIWHCFDNYQIRQAVGHKSVYIRIAEAEERELAEGWYRRAVRNFDVNVVV